MKKILYFLMLFVMATPVVAKTTGIITSASPPNTERVVKSLLEHKHLDHLYSYVSIVKRANGERLLKIKHSNGTKGEHNIYFAVVCNETKKVGKDHQYIGFSLHGSVERLQYYKLTCPSNNIGIHFSSNEEWNLIGMTLKIVSTIWGSYTW